LHNWRGKGKSSSMMLQVRGRVGKNGLFPLEVNRNRESQKKRISKGIRPKGVEGKKEGRNLRKNNGNDMPIVHQSRGTFGGKKRPGKKRSVHRLGRYQQSGDILDTVKRGKIQVAGISVPIHQRPPCPTERRRQGKFLIPSWSREEEWVKRQRTTIPN